ncbi:hypothetical protein K1T71_006040 [Dendrolimus kikuchii]|uniref:Uncharacterized protein n=1 Tax=Dendrolimus kikuchii TaxID=765133 RepID=A0ACC1D301_9NEOP|nr:hypothetical protein K1T71_006040 [Dendrolimus kikuchii]
MRLGHLCISVHLHRLGIVSNPACECDENYCDMNHIFISCPIESNEEIRYILKFYYKKDKNATQAAKKICDVYGPNAVSVRVAQIWFKRFQSGNFDIKDARRSGRPVTDKIDAIFEKVEQDRY